MRVVTKKGIAPQRAGIRSVFLVGFMGAGKSSVGRVLARRMNWIFEDLDDRIEQREGRTVPEIFRDAGEAYFRRAEQEAVHEVLDELHGGNKVRIVALGGGAFVQPAIAELLERARVPTIFLDAPLEELWRRCEMQAKERGAERPLLTTRDRFSELYRARCEAYLRAALRIDTGGRGVDSVADEIVRALKKVQGSNAQ